VPGGPAQVFEQEGTPKEAASIALMRAMLQALEDNKESAYLSTMANDVEIFTLDRAQPVRGKDPVERLFRTLRKTIGDLDTVVHNAWGVQQFAVVEYSIAGLQLAPLGRIPFVPNRLFSTRLVDVAEVRNGKITRIWRYDDSGALEPSK
jgi:ketosteroid isomerase-like protein